MSVRDIPYNELTDYLVADLKHTTAGRQDQQGLTCV